ncbi:MAG: phosphatase PAP2/dual specificity phosphatase family protein [Chthoniobacteraceae bacterium]
MKRPWLAAIGTVALTGGLFIVIYNLCNWLTHLRPDVGVWDFAWERHWPVVPAMIVPYWSLDFLYILAPFLCRTREELGVLRRRLIFVTIAAGLGFLAIPLQFAFPRPHVEGIFAPMFAALYSFDLPHNLFPSLHLALRTVLTSFYLRKTSGAGRWLVHGWFSLVGISTLLTWQHHLVDVLGGVWLGAIAIHLFRHDELAAPRAHNIRIACYYALGAIICSQLARLAFPWTVPFVWPASALGIAAFGYAGFGGNIYRKHAGQLTWPTKVLLGPMLFGQWISWRYYRTKSPPWNEVSRGVWIGALLTSEEALSARNQGVTSVLDLCVEFSEPAAFRELHYTHFPVLDLTAPTAAQFTTAAEIIETESARGIIYIHCKAGYSRSAGAVGAWLLQTGRARTVEGAAALLIAVRPGIVIRPEIREALRQFENAKLSPQSANGADQV